ncbi:MAG TPA: nitroreductase family protein [Candidatus Binataceae bacterium]|nr:nitroreductase family protein [Candidatus Binataceae bacterium]
MAELGVFEAIHTARALRRFKPDPVPAELIDHVLEAAVCAPSGGNAQDWYFVVITDPEQRRRVGAAYAKASLSIRPYYENRPRPAHMTESEERHLKSSGFYLHEHMHEAPVLLLVCGRNRAPRPGFGNLGEPGARMAVCTTLASIYPAVQNIILACRALGLGTVLTTNHLLCEDEIKAAVGIPDDVHTYALMPIGYPIGNFGLVRRKPLTDVAIHDRWGNPWKS